MKVEDLMSRNVISSSLDEHVSSALAKMKKGGIHQLPVIDGSEYKGMLALKSVVTKRIDPSRSKCENFYVPTATLKRNMSAEESVQALLNAGSRALPVIDDGKIVGILSESDLMRIVQSSRKAENIMTECEYVAESDNVGKIKKIMTSKNVSRVPVISKGSIVGVVGTLNLIDLLLTASQGFESRGRTVRNKAFREPQPLDKIRVSTVMEEPKTISKDASVNDIAKILQKEEEVFVMEDVPYVITQKDVLETILPSQERGVYVQVMNIHGEDVFAQAKIDSMTTDFVRRVGKMSQMQSLILHIEKHTKGGKTKYSIRTRMFPGVYVSHAWDWDLVGATQAALDKLEKEVKKIHGKQSHHDAERRSKAAMRE